MTERWAVLGASVRGDSHRRNGAPNQDALALIPGDHRAPLVAVADGHGSAKSFRSDVGSQLAVSAAVRCARTFAARQPEAASTADLEARAKEGLVHPIVDAWIGAVRADLAERPFSEEERARLGAEGEDAVREVGDNPLIAYGATLLVGLMVGRHLLIAQLGDGDVLAVAGDGEVARPLPSDPRLVGNETTSLCLPDAERDFRVRAVDLEARGAPTLVVLTTDGYANSFVDDGAFLQAGPDIQRMIRERGLDWVGEQLADWLTAASKLGSGDDITMGLLCRIEERLRGNGASVATATTAPPEDASGASGSRAGAPSMRANAWRLAIALTALAAGVAIGLAVGGGDPTPARVARTSGPTPAASVSAAPGWVWAGGDHLARTTDGRPDGTVITEPKLRGATVTGIASDDAAIWVALADRTVLLVDPHELDPTTAIDLPVPPAGVWLAGRSVVVAAADGSRYFLIDPRSPHDVTERRTPPGGGGSSSPAPTGSAS